MEVKRPGEPQRKSQEDFQQIIEDMGGEYAVVTSVDEAKSQLKKWNLLKWSK